MSHTVTGTIKLDNESALQLAIESQGLETLPHQEHRLYSGTYTGIGVKLDGWKYPVVINQETGEFWYDNYNGSWGRQEQLDKFIQDYTVQTMCQAAAANNYAVQALYLDNGDVELTCTQSL